MRKFFAILALLALILTVAPATNVLAAGSPTAETITDGSGDGDEKPTKPGSNTGDTSPQTGSDFSLVYIAIIGAAGIALVSGKKITE